MRRIEEINRQGAKIAKEGKIDQEGIEDKNLF